jgi:hypothetical protein
MSQFDAFTSRRRGDGFSAKEMLKEDRSWVACWTCRRKHPLRSNNAEQDYQDFHARHPTGKGCIVLRIGPEQMERAIRRAERRKRRRLDAVAGFLDNASVLEAFQSSATALDLTDFNSLASSPTAGWCSQYLNNSSNLYLEYLAEIGLAAVNTAPGGLDAFYVYAASSNIAPATSTPLNTAGNACNTSSSTGTTLTFNSVATTATGFPLVKVIPYTTQDKAVQCPVFPMSQAFGGFLGKYLWYPFINDSNMTIASSGNTFQTLGVYNTVS